MIEERAITNREEWLSWRRGFVGASNIGALFGIHPYTTALRMYAEKRGVEFVEKENSVMRRGQILEPAVAKAVRGKHPEWTLREPNVYLIDHENRLAATPDFYIDGDPRGLGVLQCKTFAPSVFHRDWNEGREPPLWITLQATTEMMLSNAAFGVIAGLLVDPFDMDVYTIEVPRNPAAEAKIIARVKEFWRMVDEADEPAPDYGRDADVIAALRPAEVKGKTIDLAGNNMLPDLLEQRAALHERMKADETRCSEIDTEIKYLMGDAEVAAGLADWRITYKTTDFKAYTVDARSRRVLRITDRRGKQG
jgi:putative phage-type endonuclease